MGRDQHGSHLHRHGECSFTMPPPNTMANKPFASYSKYRSGSEYRSYKAKTQGVKTTITNAKGEEEVVYIKQVDPNSEESLNRTRESNSRNQTPVWGGVQPQPMSYDPQKVAQYGYYAEDNIYGQSRPVTQSEARSLSRVNYVSQAEPSQPQYGYGTAVTYKKIGTNEQVASVQYKDIRYEQQKPRSDYTGGQGRIDVAPKQNFFNRNIGKIYEAEYNIQNKQNPSTAEISTGSLLLLGSFGLGYGKGVVTGAKRTVTGQIFYEDIPQGYNFFKDIFKGKTYDLSGNILNSPSSFAFETGSFVGYGKGSGLVIKKLNPYSNIKSNYADLNKQGFEISLSEQNFGKGKSIFYEEPFKTTKERISPQNTYLFGTLKTNKLNIIDVASPSEGIFSRVISTKNNRYSIKYTFNEATGKVSQAYFFNNRKLLSFSKKLPEPKVQEVYANDPNLVNLGQFEGKKFGSNDLIFQQSGARYDTGLSIQSVSGAKIDTRARTTQQYRELGYELNLDTGVNAPKDVLVKNVYIKEGTPIARQDIKEFSILNGMGIKTYSKLFGRVKVTSIEEPVGRVILTQAPKGYKPSAPLSESKANLFGQIDFSKPMENNIYKRTAPQETILESPETINVQVNKQISPQTLKAVDIATKGSAKLSTIQYSGAKSKVFSLPSSRTSSRSENQNVMASNMKNDTISEIKPFSKISSRSELNIRNEINTQLNSRSELNTDTNLRLNTRTNLKTELTTDLLTEQTTSINTGISTPLLNIQTPKIPIINLGGKYYPNPNILGFSFKRKKSKKRKYRYNPTVTSTLLKIKSKSILDDKSGFSIRPLSIR